jgi:MYXO-CTERM domain-containing protein
MERMDQRTDSDTEPPHDILAAEMFAVPAPDPRLHAEPPHEILAAEHFAVPAPDPILHHATLTLPEDLTGSPAPHDVLAAEEFAIPAPTEAHPHRPQALGRDTPWPLSAAAWALLVLLALFARRRHRLGKRTR